MAVATGIAPSVWADEGSRAIVTAVQILEEQENRSRGGTRDLGAGGPSSSPQFSG